MKELLKRKKPLKPISSAEFNYHLGKKVIETAKHPEKSLLAVASKLNIPIYVPAFSDSSIAMNIASCITKKTNISIDTLFDVAETAAIVLDSKKNGAIEIGGGTPKNFYLQTQPMLWQCLRIPKGGHDYFVQLTTDSPQWGGLSGATPQEAKSWGKVKKEAKTYSVVYSCASITFPLLCQYVKQVCKPRKQKELYLKRMELVNKLDEASLKVPENITEHTEIFDEPPEPFKAEDFYDEEEIKKQIKD
jgi:deoxyhypusine synthase